MSDSGSENVVLMENPFGVDVKQSIYYQELGKVVNEHITELTLIEIIGGLEVIKAEILEQSS